MSACHDEFEATLALCGVEPGSLSERARADLDVRGYHVLPDVVGGAWLAELHALVEAHSSEDSETGTYHAQLLNAHHVAVDRVLHEPRMLAAAYHLLERPFRWSGLSSRDPRPGFGAQGLHTDWPPRTRGEPAHSVTAIWMLDDFTLDNGATRVVPGTHQHLRGPDKPLAQPGRRHDAQVLATGAAGSVLVFSGHLWHSGTVNRSRAPRRALQLSLVTREQRGVPLLEHPDPTRLGAAGLVLLGLQD